MAEWWGCAYAATGGHEGGWVNNLTDTGGETVQGISRVHWPQWSGWPIVDAHKSHLDIAGAEKSAVLDEALANDYQFQAAVRLFYETNFWNHAHCHVIAKKDGTLAMLVYDAAVNHGSYNAITFLQQALNLLNDNGKTFPDLVEDGKYGAKTDEALRAVVFNRVVALRTWYIIFRGQHYTRFMKRSSEQEAFANGWARRLAYWMALASHGYHPNER